MGWIPGYEGPLWRQLRSDGLHCGAGQKITHSGRSLPTTKVRFLIRFNYRFRHIFDRFSLHYTALLCNGVMTIDALELAKRYQISYDLQISPEMPELVRI